MNLYLYSRDIKSFFFNNPVWKFPGNESNFKFGWLTHPILNQSRQSRDAKPRLMNARSIINKSIIIFVFILAGFLLARSFYYGSLIGIISALVGIAAWTMFLYKLSSMQSEKNDQEEIIENY